MDGIDTRAPPPRWPWIAAAWTAVALIDASQTVLPMRALGIHRDWVGPATTSALIWLPWALATPLVIRIGRRYPPTRSTRAPGWIAHLGAIMAIGLIYAGWYVMLETLLNPPSQTPAPGPFVKAWMARFFYGQLFTVLLYAFVLTVDYALESRQRMARQQMESAQLSEQLHKAQLDALRRQIEPHFMYNSLNAIAGLVRDNRNPAAVEMIVALSEFLRGAAVDSNQAQVALEQEVQYLQRYLEIEKARFAERLLVTLDIPAELLAARVPILILQPLVENAIKHGISKRTQGGALEVRASRSGSLLSLSVANDGPPLRGDWENQGTGIGMSNLRTRLQIMYGGAFELHLRNRATGGVQALIRLPFVDA
ncbi:MAG TPA: histidine kinase [Steroidobacteraceae bacterium]